MKIPPVSPYSLIQESLWPDEWKCLVACVMLNCTSRKQVEKVLPAFFDKWPTATAVACADPEVMAEAIASLGFKHRRSQRLVRLAKEYTAGGWTHVRQLSGIGEYASRMWEMFFLGVLGDDQPSDGALTLYWKWRHQITFHDEPSQ
jgi:methyl-CpG-binding domain protein 4